MKRKNKGPKVLRNLTSREISSFEVIENQITQLTISLRAFVAGIQAGEKEGAFVSIRDGVVYATAPPEVLAQRQAQQGMAPPAPPAPDDEPEEQTEPDEAVEAEYAAGPDEKPEPDEAEEDV